MSKNKILLIFAINFFNMHAAEVVKKTEIKKTEVKKDDVKKVEVKEIKKENIEKIEKDETSINLETTFKFNYNQHFNPNYSPYENTDEDKNKDAFDTEEAVSFMYKENFYNIDFFNSKFKFNLYDDIEFFIPFGISYKMGYPQKTIDILKKFYLSRAIITNLGFSLSWKALDYLKLGINGDCDEDAGYAFNFESKLFKHKDNQLDTEGTDIFRYGIGIFGQFELKNSFLEFKPKLRIKINKGRELKNRNESNQDLSPASGSTIITPLISLPLDFKWELMEDLKLMLNLSLNSHWAFVDERYLEAIKFENSGLKIDPLLKMTLEYKMFNVVKLILPFKASSTNEFFRNEKAAKDWSVTSLYFTPKIDFSYDLLNNLKLIADMTLDWNFFEFDVSSTKATSKIFIDPRLKWGIGFKFDSAL